MDGIESATIDCAIGAKGFADQRPLWEHLCSDPDIVHPSASPVVIASAIEHLIGADTSTRFFVARVGDNPLAALACVSEPMPWGAGAQQLRVFGDHELYPLPLIARAGSSLAAAELMRTALGHTGRYRRLCLTRQWNRTFFDALRREATDLVFSFSHAGFGSYLPIPATEETIWRACSSNFRKNLKKQLRRLSTAGTASWRFLRGRECAPDNFEEFFALEASGWKADAGGAIRTHASKLAYYRSMLFGLAQRGQLELHFLDLEGRPIAAQLGVRRGGVLSLLKIAYDEGYAQLAPGNMLFLESLRRSISSQEISELNCLTDMAWHRNWGMDRREYVDVEVYPRTFSAITVAYAPRAIKQWLASNWYLRKAKGLLERRSES